MSLILDDLARAISVIAICSPQILIVRLGLNAVLLAEHLRLQRVYILIADRSQTASALGRDMIAVM